MIPSPTAAAPAHVIVFGNEKGGSGKSTAAFHVVIGLARQGYSVAAIDLDARQGTLSRYLANRQAFAQRTAQDLPCPIHWRLDSDTAQEPEQSENWLEAVLYEVIERCDFVVIDTPGADTAASRLAHSKADILITPINDSFIDLDLLANIDADTHEIRGASLYAETVWDQRKARFQADGGQIDWIVMRNRLGHTEARNKRDIGVILEKLAKRIGFRLAPGFGERVIFRELFLKGLTLLDLRRVEQAPSLTMSHVAARQEIRALLNSISPESLREGRATSLRRSA